MKNFKVWCLHIVVILAMLGLIDNALAQDSTRKPFIGGSANLLGISKAGWGLELGIKYDIFYVDAEYGNYDYGYREPVYVFPSLYRVLTPRPISLVQYYGISTGIIINKKLWIGPVILLSSQSFSHYVSVAQGDSSHYQERTYDITWLDLGLDIRYEIIDHLLLNSAFSYRRGIKLGIAYLW